jgi:4-amino-4-deoxy-L-arabinose transferase-like glycosyltransferase
MLIPARAGGAPVARAERPARVTRIAPHTLTVAALVLAGAVLRFATLTNQSFWFDEAQAVHEMHLSFGGLFSFMTAHETNPPLFFVLGWVWTRGFGDGQAGLRSLSAVAGTAAIPVAYLCGRELVSRRAGLVAAALTTLSPFMIWYSQEAREYMLLAALSGASLFWFARALRTRAARDLGWWAAFSALAVLTHSFAGFLVFTEALGLVYALRSRASLVAGAAVAAVQAALLPLLFTHATHSLLGFIKATSLSIRVRQVPVGFALGSLYQSSLVDYGLLGAALVVALLIGLLVVGTDGPQLRGAGIAAALGAVVLVVPLLLALAGEDYYIVRALMPAWIPLAVVVGAACTAPRARIAGAALGVTVVAAFVWAQARIQSEPRYQRPDWRGVAAALGPAPGTRAVVVYDGLATDPLAIYLPRVAWSAPRAPITVAEVDVVGLPWQTPAGGARLIGSRTVDGYLVDRFSLTPAWTSTPSAIAARAATQLLGPAPPDAGVLVQRGAATRPAA